MAYRFENGRLARVPDDPARAKLETVEELWRDYAADVLGPAGVDPASVQATETRRAFYAAAHAVLCELFRIGDDDVSEVAGMVHMELMRRDCERFLTDLKAGRA